MVENPTPPIGKMIETHWRRCAYEGVFKKIKIIVEQLDRILSGLFMNSSPNVEVPNEHAARQHTATLSSTIRSLLRVIRDIVLMYEILFNYCRKYCAYNIQNADGIYQRVFRSRLARALCIRIYYNIILYIIL